MIDLHTHSVISDGSETPERIAELAAAAGLSAFALTDHDSFDGLARARAAADRLDLRLLPGCEVSCKADGGGSKVGSRSGASIHVLCYFPGLIDATVCDRSSHDPTDAGSNSSDATFAAAIETPLGEELRRLRNDRLVRNRKLVDRLRELGIEITWDELVETAGTEGGIGRPHFARLIVEKGYATDMQDAFERWLGNGAVAYVPKARLGPMDVARLARASGAVAVLAHPLSLQLAPGEYEPFAEELAEAGFGGFEAIYGRYSPEEREALAAIARKAGLVPTGGSDYHGTFKPDLSVGRGTGDLDVPDAVLEELASRQT